MNIAMHNPAFQSSKNESIILKNSVTNEPTKSWEIWHQQYGHIIYDNLQKLYHLKSVDGFNVDTHTLKLDCVACTQAKQHKNCLIKQQIK